ncbi:MAG: deoxyribodipyrimidine photo-lyase, partial [Bacteroidota bacterium]
MNKEEIAIFWFRRDLRLTDNAGLYHALKSGLPVLPVFIFDTHILNDLEDRYDKRVDFIHQCIDQLKEELCEHGSDLIVLHDTPQQAWVQLLQQYKICNVFANTDYEPYAKKRDGLVKGLLEVKNVGFHTYKDQCVFDHTEVLKEDGTPYTVFTPYSKKWKAKLNDFFIKPYPIKKYLKNLYQVNKRSKQITLQDLGFEKTTEDFPSQQVNQVLIKNYDKTRDIPSIHGTSRLGIHFRFGTISIRQKAAKAKQLN